MAKKVKHNDCLIQFALPSAMRERFLVACGVVGVTQSTIIRMLIDAWAKSVAADVEFPSDAD